MKERALQDVLRVHCYGCGTLNEHGLQIKSLWEDDELVCRWQPKPYQIGYPGWVYGGVIASIVDCHAIWTAQATECRERGLSLDGDRPPPFAFVTGKLSVSYLKPARIDQPLELRAHAVSRSDRRVTVACRVWQREVECASAEVVTVRMQPQGAA